MKYVPKEEGEYKLFVEEKIRECMPAIISRGKDEDGKEIAGVLLVKKIENKEKYLNIDAETHWEAVIDRNIGVEKIFLTIIFKDENLEKMNFCFDLEDQYTRNHIAEWFVMIIANGSIIGLCDGDLPSIIIRNVPLDVPLEIMRDTVNYFS